MFDSLIRNFDSLTRIAKAVACCLVAVAAVWRGYAVITDVGSLYTMVLCLLFAFTMVGIAVSLINEPPEEA